MKIDIGNIQVGDRLLMYKSYVQLLKPILGGNLGTRSVDVLAAIMYYTNKIKGEYKNSTELKRALGTQKAKSDIRDLVPEMYKDSKKPFMHSVDEKYFQVITTDLRKRGFLCEDSNTKMREKSIMLRNAKIFNIAFSEDTEIELSMKVVSNEGNR